MTSNTAVQILQLFSRVYPAQFSKLDKTKKQELVGTWLAVFGDRSDSVMTTAAAIIVKKSSFLPLLPEFEKYIKRAELIETARAIDEINNAKVERVLRDVETAQDVERFLLWLGDKPETAHATAWAGVEGRLTE